MDSKQENESQAPKTAGELIDESRRIISARGAIYGHNFYTMDRTARMRSAMSGFPETRHKVAIDYALGKLARIAETEGSRNRDSYIDALCYIAIAYEMAVADPYDFYDDDQS